MYILEYMDLMSKKAFKHSSIIPCCVRPSPNFGLNCRFNNFQFSYIYVHQMAVVMYQHIKIYNNVVVYIFHITYYRNKTHDNDYNAEKRLI